MILFKQILIIPFNHTVYSLLLFLHVNKKNPPISCKSADFPLTAHVCTEDSAYCPGSNRYEINDTEAFHAERTCKYTACREDYHEYENGSGGGTGSTIQYARSRGVELLPLWI